MREPLSARFHRWLERQVQRLFGRGERFIMYAGGREIAKHGIAIGHPFTEPLTYRRWVCTDIRWQDDDFTAMIYGRPE